MNSSAQPKVRITLLDLEELEEENLAAFRTKYQALASAARAELSRGIQDTGTPEP
jgi:hypothetical protein